MISWWGIIDIISTQTFFHQFVQSYKAKNVNLAYHLKAKSWKSSYSFQSTQSWHTIFFYEIFHDVKHHYKNIETPNTIIVMLTSTSLSWFLNLFFSFLLQKPWEKQCSSGKRKTNEGNDRNYIPQTKKTKRPCPPSQKILIH
jgi:hypothetical protein